jgi:Cdc6-like AAA superfamily ATPase
VEFTTALERLQQVLKEAQHRVCIVIEGLEVWGTGKSRDQSLAYALAELPMTRPGHVSVLALTARLDVAEAALDKRVRSRMAQGVVTLEWPEDRTLLQDVFAVLQVPVRECEGVLHSYCIEFNARVTALHGEMSTLCARMADWSKDRRRYLDLLVRASE